MTSFLIAGLGNIGSDYAHTRHNIGFDILDHLAKQQDACFDLDRHAYYCRFGHKGKTFHLIKPTTYMNLSGKAVRYWMQQLNISTPQVLVVLDDKDLPFGKLRLRAKGSDGSHNGLKSISEILQNNQYARLRFGIGSDFGRGKQVQFVLGKWSNDEAAELPNHVEKAAEAILNFGLMGIERTMNLCNQK